jgi:hypothetical protein
MKEIISFNNQIKLCVLDTNEWILKHNEKFIPINDFTISLLPLLEEQYENFILNTKEKEVSTETFKTFPLINLLKYPFDNKRICWSELSMNWIEKLQNIDDLKEWSKDISLDWMPQKLKHRFFKKFRASVNHRPMK